MPKTYLKIKIKSLAAEARIIRQEEIRWRGGHPVRNGLHDHRVRAVRAEARAALLAYGYLRGRPYGALEAPQGNGDPGRRQTNQLNLTRVAGLATKYGSVTVTVEALTAWAEAPAAPLAEAAD